MRLFLSWKEIQSGRFLSCARQPLLRHERASRNQQNAINLHLNTWLPLSLKLTFSSQNRYQKFSLRTACLGPCPWGKEEEKVTCPKGKSTCPGRPDGGFFEPWLALRSFSLASQEFITYTICNLNVLKICPKKLYWPTESISPVLTDRTFFAHWNTYIL